MPLELKAENSAASILYKRHPPRWLRRHSHGLYLPLTVTIRAKVDLFKSDFFSSNVKLLENKDNFWAKLHLLGGNFEN